MTNNDVVNTELLPTPGGVLEDYLDELGISRKQFGKLIGHQTTAISQIIEGKRRISAEMAIKLAKALGTTPDLWMNMQSFCDLQEAHKRVDVDAIETLVNPLTPEPQHEQLGAGPA